MTATARNLSCAERVNAEWEDRRRDLAMYMKHGCFTDNISEDADSDVREFYEDVGDFLSYALGFDYVEPGTFDDQSEPYWRFQMSWGGPSDEIRFFSNDGNFPVRIEYWFLDWFDGAKLDVSDSEEALWVWNRFKELGSIRAEGEEV